MTPETPKKVEEAPAPYIYTEEEVNVREDLLEKLLTLEHVKSILVVRDESPVYLNQINSLQRIVQSWYNAEVAKKAQQVKPAAEPEKQDAGEGDE